MSSSELSRHPRPKASKVAAVPAKNLRLDVPSGSLDSMGNLKLSGILHAKRILSTSSCPGTAMARFVCFAVKIVLSSPLLIISK